MKDTQSFCLTNSLRCVKILSAELWRFRGFFHFPLDFSCQGVLGKTFEISTGERGGARGFAPLALGTYLLGIGSFVRGKGEEPTILAVERADDLATLNATIEDTNHLLG